jgi:hypothetical protein
MRQDAANAPRTYAKSRTGSRSERYSYELERPEEFLTLPAEELLTCPYTTATLREKLARDALTFPAVYSEM